MTHELVYTSAPRGLRPGSIGYCVVAQTDGIPHALVERLETLSAYRHLRVGADPDANGNPVVHAHTIASAGGRTYHVLSRIADTGLDYSGRNNYLAHHVALTADDLPRGGPAAACEAWPFETAWDGTTGSLPAGRSAAGGTADVQKCVRWEEATGDAGWAGVLAGATTGEPAYLVFRPDQDVLGLVAEALALVPPEDRWRVTFSTYFTKAGGAECQWRCVPAGSAEAKAAISARRGVVLRLDRDTPDDDPPVGGLVDAARTGVLPPRRQRPERLAEAPVARPTRVANFDAPPDDFEEVDAETSAEAMPAAPRARPAARPLPATSAPSRGLGQLLLGLAMGLLLAVVALAVIEVGAKASPLRLAGVVGKREEEVAAERDKMKADLDAAKTDVEKANKARETEVERVNAANRVAEDSIRREAKAKVEAAEQERDGWKDKHAKLKRETANLKYTEEQYAKATTKARAEGVAEGKAQAHTPPKKENPVPPKPEPAASVSAAQRGEFLKGDMPRPLFTTSLKGKPTLDVFGLPDGLKMERKGDTVALKEGGGQDDKFYAELKVVDGVVKVVTSRNLERFPLLGLAVVGVKTDAGSEFFHLTLSELTASGVLASGKESDDTYRFESKLFASFKTEFLTREFRERVGKKELTLGAKAKVSVNGKEYDLVPDKDHKDERVCAPKAGGDEPEKIVLRLEPNGTLSLHVKYAKAEVRRDLACRIVAADLVRDVKVNGAAVRQDVLSIRTPESEKK